MQLSKRLYAVADMVTLGNRVADIGCDHAYVSIYLTENDICPHVIAMDVNQGPIDRARENIRRYGFEDRIETRKSNGLEKLHLEEADTILLAGMGGELMLQILTLRQDILSGISELILQPQSEIHKVRMGLDNMGFLIICENMIVDEGKYYVVMKARPMRAINAPDDYRLVKKEDFYFGRLLLEDKHPMLMEYLNRELEQCNRICHTLMQENTEKSVQRQKEIMDKINLIQTAMTYFN